MKSIESTRRPEHGSTDRTRRRLLELRRSITSGYWRERKASRVPFEEVDNLFELAAYSLESDIVISLGELEREQILLIEEALRRIAKGSYGLCTECGGRIPSARLEAIPWAPFCVRCQQMLESEPRHAA